MATRPSTAEILAAARAADGRKTAPANGHPAKANGNAAAPPPAGNAKPPAEPQPAPAAPPVTVPAASEVDGGLAPASIAAILSEVRGPREAAGGEIRPPSIRGLLAKIRGAAPDAPPSIAAILGEVRGLAGPNGTPRPQPITPTKPAPPKPAAAAQPGRRPSTADILAAARNQTAGAGAASAKPPAPPRSSKTADILAAARRQGVGAARSTAPPSDRPSPAGKPKPQPAASKPPAALGSADARPKPVSDILSAVRAAAAAAEAARYPSLTEMVAALRRLDAEVVARRRPRQESKGWAARLRRWFTEDRDSHRGASI